MACAVRRRGHCKAAARERTGAQEKAKVTLALLTKKVKSGNSALPALRVLGVKERWMKGGWK
ncbi:hypothetical protein E2C01_032914 [Portunus trituberculatus]|uniref:Uncharacterized protein n=1 Tax=Portunus trituberculatus TaxID=210409 RepID=A0A5B7F2C1_PORTR|nr:hypothetical protein [Portunus trituberculatus]